MVTSVFLTLLPLFTESDDMSKCRFNLEESFSFNKELNQITACYLQVMVRSAILKWSKFVLGYRCS